MTESRTQKIIREFLQDLQLDVIEERIINYIVREVRLGRRLSSVLQDPYIKNRLTQQQVDEIIESPEVLEAVERELAEAFETQDFKFKE
ncbi:MAG: hypothetical protein C4521_05830 [Actinobacteria bacterium]|nr:MAG: hypothetical protein C4521_05830 [Actinomycetota bacterium]